MQKSNAINYLLSENGQLLWARETRYEILQLLVKVWPYLDRVLAKDLLDAILIGPPRDMFDNMDDQEWEIFTDRCIWFRLNALAATQRKLPAAASKKLSEIRGKYPMWKLKVKKLDEQFPLIESDEEAIWPLMEKEKLPLKRKALVKRLRTDTKKKVVANDNWENICKEHPSLAALVLIDLSKKNVWLRSRWEECLHIFSNEPYLNRSIVFARVLLNSPDNFICDTFNAIAWWLKAVVKHGKGSNKEVLLKLLDKLLAITPSTTEAMEEQDNDLVFEAINHPVGMSVQALIMLFYAEGPRVGEGLKKEFATRFDCIMSNTSNSFRYGKVIIASELVALFSVDVAWTIQNILPYFSWKDEINAQSVWVGYLRSNKISQELLNEIQPFFLETAKNYSHLAKQGPQFADLIVFCAIEWPNDFGGNDLRQSLTLLPTPALAYCASTLARYIANSPGTRESMWKNRIKPIVEKAWPKERNKQTPAASRYLARVCIYAGKEFEQAVEILTPFIVPIQNFEHVVEELLTQGHPSCYPRASLKLLDKLVSDEEKWLTDSLKQALEVIKNEDKRLVKEPAYRRLKEYLMKIGHS